MEASSVRLCFLVLPTHELPLCERCMCSRHVSSSDLVSWRPWNGFQRNETAWNRSWPFAAWPIESSSVVMVLVKQQGPDIAVNFPLHKGTMLPEGRTVPLARLWRLRSRLLRVLQDAHLTAVLLRAMELPVA